MTRRCIQATTIMLDRRIQFAALEMRVAFVKIFQAIASLDAVGHSPCSRDTAREEYSPGIEAVLIPLACFVGGSSQPEANAGITSRANQRSCSSNSRGDRPSAQWIM